MVDVGHGQLTADPDIASVSLLTLSKTIRVAM